MAYYGGSYFGPSYYGNAYWGTGLAAPVVVIDHDGFDEKKRHDGKRKAKERLHNQLEEAFYDAFGGRPVMPVAPVIARNDEPLVEFVFPAYREKPIEDDEEAELLLLST